MIKLKLLLSESPDAINNAKFSLSYESSDAIAFGYYDATGEFIAGDFGDRHIDLVPDVPDSDYVDRSDFEYPGRVL